MLKASDLAKTHKDKLNKDKQTYKELLNECYSRIKNRNAQNVYNCIYTIPIIAMGKPLYNASDAMEYILTKLKKGGFSARALRGTTIYVEWGHAMSSRSSKSHYKPL